MTEQISYQDLLKHDDQALDRFLRDLPTSLLITHVAILQAAIVSALFVAGDSFVFMGDALEAKLCVDRLLPAFHREIDRRLPRPE